MAKIKRFVATMVLGVFAAGSIGAYAVSNSSSTNNIQTGIKQGVTATAADTSNTTGDTMYQGQSGQSGIYAAMGDSVAAGQGLAPLSNPSSLDTQCGRSSQGYPSLVAQQTGMNLIDAACGGATVGDLYTQQDMTEGNPAAQLDTAFSQGTPQLITITAGANDAHWIDFIRACYATDCATPVDQGLASFYLAGVKAKLAYVLSQIQSRSNGSTPTVIVTGYYNPISDYCKNRQNYITNDEIDFLNKQRDDLNQAIRDTAANYPFARYASTNFDSHGLCSTDPWAQSLTDPAPLHPTAAGQQQISSSVLNTMQPKQ